MSHMWSMLVCYTSICRLVWVLERLPLHLHLHLHLQLCGNRPNHVNIQVLEDKDTHEIARDYSGVTNQLGLHMARLIQSLPSSYMHTQRTHKGPSDGELTCCCLFCCSSTCGMSLLLSFLWFARLCSCSSTCCMCLSCCSLCPAGPPTTPPPTLSSTPTAPTPTTPCAVSRTAALPPWRARPLLLA
jgi:hypothetical protein